MITGMNSFCGFGREAGCGRHSCIGVRTPSRYRVHVVAIPIVAVVGDGRARGEHGNPCISSIFWRLLWSSGATGAGVDAHDGLVRVKRYM
jgi:hypothetical protein